MERKEAIAKLEKLKGRDLHDLAREFGMAVSPTSRPVNKGWAGHVLERYLGLQLNSAQSPNFGSWELKSVPLNHRRDGSLGFKETMAITMIDPYHVARTPFEKSHLLSKLRKAVIVARVVGEKFSDPTHIHSVIEIDLLGETYETVRRDYELVQECLNDPSRGFSALTGRMGVYIQPRTKGAGHGSVSRAFYARPSFLSQFIDLSHA
ncbi:MAG: MvaI/BcnI family restriction endonuclease [Zoogloeaceae bacterium]|jgi:DNA mismatch repair protein MutH|nr:MvaI/BcnI family restriction endonuclease [Zoogloeaceae bacterium]